MLHSLHICHSLIPLHHVQEIRETLHNEHSNPQDKCLRTMNRNITIQHYLCSLSTQEFFTIVAGCRAILILLASATYTYFVFMLKYWTNGNSNTKNRQVKDK